MFIFEEPYISDIAERFLVDSQAPLLANDFARARVSPEANHMPAEEAVRHLDEQGCRWLYSNSENVIGWIRAAFGVDSPVARRIEFFKNKFGFREATAHLFPDIRYLQVTASELADLPFEAMGEPFIIKPMVGFLSAGVYRVNSPEEWRHIRQTLTETMAATAQAFPREVLSSEAFLLESIVGGEEYAVDAYFDEENRPVVLNILQHTFSSAQDMSDRLYVTSARIIEEQLAVVEKFLTDIAALGDFRGLPLHAEIRRDSQGQVRPIEINPLRFAGWCSTDIASYAYDINVYDYFAGRKRPDWQRIVAEAGDATYAMAVIERGESLARNQRFDYGRLQAEFSDLLCLREIDSRSYPLYAFLFFRVTEATEHELAHVLHLKTADYVTADSGTV